MSRAKYRFPSLEKMDVNQPMQDSIERLKIHPKDFGVIILFLLVHRSAIKKKTGDMAGHPALGATIRFSKGRRKNPTRTSFCAGSLMVAVFGVGDAMGIF